MAKIGSECSIYKYNKLRGKMKEEGRTQNEVAAAAGMCHSTLSQKLNGKKFFRQSEIAKICDFLKIPPDEIGAYFFAS